MRCRPASRMLLPLAFLSLCVAAFVQARAQPGAQPGVQATPDPAATQNASPQNPTQ